MMKTTFKQSEDYLASFCLFMQKSQNLQDSFCRFFFESWILPEKRFQNFRNYEFAEGIIDSTYNTNYLKLEFFNIIFSVFGTEFQLAYLFEQGKKSIDNDDLTQKHMLEYLMNKMRRILQI